MRFPPLVPARFLRRENRFRVRVWLDGREVAAHLPNSGRLHELLVPGRTVYLTSRPRRDRKTQWDMLLVDVGGRLVSVDARLPPRLLLEAWQTGHIPWLPFGPEVQVQTEPACNEGRLDLLFTCGPMRVWVETKSVTWVENGLAFFPDAPTVRGRRHLACLEARVRAGDRGLAVFVVQRDDAQAFAPHPADPAFPQALRQAHAQGVEIRALMFQVTLEAIAFVREIPVRLDASPQRA